MKRTNLIAVSVASVIAFFFLYVVLTPPSYFNALPFAIHQALFKTVKANGEVIHVIEETTFIRIFDVGVAIIIYWIVYKVTKSLTNRLKKTV